MKNKKPRRGEVFCSVFLRLVAASTLYYVNEKVYAIGEEGAIFTTVLLM
jgi:hypothetical protein